MADLGFASAAEALTDIRDRMQRSGRVLSLSGLSGVWAGVCAIAAGLIAYVKVGLPPFSGVDYATAYVRTYADPAGLEAFLLLLGTSTLTLAVAGALYFTLRRARRGGYEVWNAASRAMLVSMLAPLVACGVLVLAHWHHGDYGYSAALTLVGYGVALLAGARYTHDELRTLGYLEVALGLLTAFLPGYGIEAWIFGFGVLHVVYGLLMYRRHGA